MRKIALLVSVMVLGWLVVPAHAGKPTPTAPKIQIQFKQDMTKSETQGGATFTVTRNSKVGTSTVDYYTQDGTAMTSDSDYVAKSGTLTFIPGVTSQDFIVTILPDGKDEDNETVNLFLANPTTNSQLGSKKTATLTILDTNASPTLRIDDWQTGGAGATEGGTLPFTVTKTGTTARTVTVHYASSSGSATDGTDYPHKEGNLTFGPLETSKTINVLPTDDASAEGYETLTMTLTVPTNATLSDGSGEGRITDNDDDDNDGASDTDEVTNGSDPNDPDTDNDNISDGSRDPDGSSDIVAGPDNCLLVANPGQADNELDGLGDDCDPDDDNDLVLDGPDNCDFVANPGQLDTDGGGAGDACDEDDDNDFVDDVNDNCPLDVNTGQENNDGDALGDVCDPDDDNDTLSDIDEVLLYGTNPLSANTDSDNWNDASELYPGYDPLSACLPDPSHVNCDLDSDGFINSADLDDDGDFLLDTQEVTAGTNAHKIDTDEDGYGDGIEVLGLGSDPLDPCSPVACGP
ncbi:MAG: large repetitive protein [Actinomycetota bacterium]|nr:large repetitive protein [Actinomycetota bacterium]